jgi:Leucine-rich repeat (LRR) protein
MNTNENIYYLNIADQEFVPNTVFCLKFLQELYVRNTGFFEFEPDDDFVRQLPPEIERLALLKYFDVFDTKVTHLPEQIGKLTHLEGLTFFNTGLVALPDSIGNLSSLIFLDLSKNKLTSLPTTIAKSRSLGYVNLENNLKLRSVQSLNGLPNLYNLSTIYCPIERLPLDLPELSGLHMYNNNLTDLIGIGTLGNKTTDLKWFGFTMNRIRFIPPSIHYVCNLEGLDLDDNQLRTLPTELFNMTTLRYLDIRNNPFSSDELEAIVAKFNTTNPSLHLYWSSMRSLPVKTQ